MSSGIRLLRSFPSRLHHRFTRKGSLEDMTVTYTKRSFTAEDSTSGASKPSLGVEWRKQQLEKLERKFVNPAVTVDSDEDLQPMWKEMEGRVTRRRPRTVAENQGRTGRENIRKTDEEYWLREGLYSEESDNEKES